MRLSNTTSQEQILNKWKIKRAPPPKKKGKQIVAPKCFKVTQRSQLSELYKIMIYGKIPPEQLYHNRHNWIISASKVISAELIIPFNSLSKLLLTRKSFCHSMILSKSHRKQ